MKTLPILVIVLSVSLLPGCSKKQPEKSPIPVTAYSVESHTVEESARYSANVQPYASVNVAFKVGGYVSEIMQVRGADGRMRNIQDGDVVRKGAVLAVLRQTEFNDRVNQAKAHLAAVAAEKEKARLDFERAVALYQTQSMTKPDYDGADARNQAAIAQYDGAGATLQQAELDQHDSLLRAPADGLLLKRAIEIGSLVGPGTLGFVLADTSAVKVVFGVPDVMVPHTKLGVPLSITTETLEGATVTGKVTRVSPAADSQTRLFDVELTVPNPRGQLKVGMIASLSFPVMKEVERPLVVPLTAVVRPKDDPAAYGVYVVKEDGGVRLASLRRVEVGEVYGNLITVRQGVERGERVVSSGTMLLTDGDKIRVVPQVLPQ